ncbi:hypothetical protein QWZ13_09030 [Reinekea marina]|uniref:Uncharacterized protein n=1 Tax=Reinekea marina TaxID=1310421 RepID=A0ABV7WTL2_9GAMM|nr:hypothetical protein [Reinekea marina]MBU2862801.1 hypothetical protein [Reinekea forsetii]MDN3649050.1 hypothetical protein [Reinekea marina]
MAKPNPKNSKKRKQEPKGSPLGIGLAVVVIMMLITFIMSNLGGFAGVQGLFGGGSNIEGQAQGSLQKAVQTCRNQVRAQLGDRLSKTYLDEMSTRYDEGKKEYLVFIDVVIKGLEKDKYYYECQVSAVNQRILKAQLTAPPGAFQQIELQ